VGRGAGVGEGQAGVAVWQALNRMEITNTSINTVFFINDLVLLR
jgi:hypothetical protein